MSPRALITNSNYVVMSRRKVGDNLLEEITEYNVCVYLLMKLIVQWKLRLLGGSIIRGLIIKVFNNF